jgi:sulfur transfer protein SufE
MLKSPRTAEWTVALSAIDDVTFKKGLASDLIAVHHGGQVTKIMSVRSDEFFTAFKAAVTLSRIALPD